VFGFAGHVLIRRRVPRPVLLVASIPPVATWLVAGAYVLSGAPRDHIGAAPFVVWGLVQGVLAGWGGLAAMGLLRGPKAAETE
jgi:hypothetical protein